MNKVLPLSEAVERYLPDGVGLVTVGGMHLHNNPMALIREVIRQNRRTKRLLTSPCGALNAELLIAAGLVDEIATSYVGFEHIGLAPCFRRQIESGTLKVLECDEAYITHGLYAGAGGLPFIALPKGIEFTDIPKVNKEYYSFTTDPFTGNRVAVGAPLKPDVALLHAYQADENGNAVLAGAHFVDRYMALASKTVLLQVERIVPTEEISKHPQGTTIPGFLVHAVVVAPGGCYPTSSHGAYEFDDRQIAQYMGMAKDDEGAKEYIKQFVTNMSEDEYLNTIAGRLAELRYGDGVLPVALSERKG
ncbi:MAG: CoA transferase subunit A [Acidimicrobiaceae bacterium]|nr:CoA transferase subunit A [Acidimicrobiaceae bacterium]